MASEDPGARVRGALTTLYAWYRETEPMFGKLFSDRASVPELDHFLAADTDRSLDELADELAAGFAADCPRASRLRAMSRLAVDFWTWRRLTDAELDDEAAAELMVSAVVAGAGV